MIGYVKYVIYLWGRYLNKLLVEGQDILIDGTERPILRSSDSDV
jgi:hypothetical protein